MDYTIQKGKTIILKSPKNIRQISVGNIVFISCDSYILSINLISQNKPVMISKPLKELEEELSSFHFFRISRKELINMKYFKSYNKNGVRKITMSTGKILSVSRRKWNDLRKYL